MTLITYFNAILIVFSQYFIILPTLNKEIIIIIIIIIIAIIIMIIIMIIIIITIIIIIRPFVFLIKS